MDNVYCDGSEDELSKCRFDGWGASDCGGGEAAGVICTCDQQDGANEDNKGMAVRKRKTKPEKRRVKDIHQQGVAIRLVGGRVYSEGRVEVKLGNSGMFRSTVCNRDLYPWRTGGLLELFRAFSIPSFFNCPGIIFGWRLEN